MVLKAMTSFIAAVISRHRPVLVNGGVGFATFAAGDVLAQGVHPAVALLPDQENSVVACSDTKDLTWLQQFGERTRGVDFERSAKVGLLGVALNGFTLGAWYKVLDKYLGASRKSMKSVLAKCVADQMVYAPFSIVSFVSYASVLNGARWKSILEETRVQLRGTFVSTWLMDWKVWPAANIIMFRFIPSSYRPSCASLVQVVWQAYLSSVSFDPHAGPSTHKPTTDPLLVKGGGGEGMPVVLSQVHVTAALPNQQHQTGLQRKRTPGPYLNKRRPTSRYAYFGPSEEAGTSQKKGEVVRGRERAGSGRRVQRGVGARIKESKQGKDGKRAEEEL